ncbi:MAG: hypothetical protein KF873_07480 [Gemmataceae bacterium]|nr:hypothetical protein [Gemmataceae bacterium]
MATAKKLISILGKSIKNAPFRALVTADRLKASTEEDLDEGQPVEMSFAGKKAGYEVSAEDGRIVAVFLYVEPRDGFAAFTGPLPYKVPRDATRTEVRGLLGKPEQSGKAYKDKILGPQGAWDRFAVDAIIIHFEYTDPGLDVALITMMTEDRAP